MPIVCRADTWRAMECSSSSVGLNRDLLLENNRNKQSFLVETIASPPISSKVPVTDRVIKRAKLSHR